MSTCIQCGKVCDSTENVWQPGEACIFGNLFACSVTCAVLWGLTPGNVRDGMRPGQPGWDMDVEPEYGQKDVVIGQLRRALEAANGAYAQLADLYEKARALVVKSGADLEAADARAEVFRLAIIPLAEGETMNPEALDLARRLVACKQWRWIAGMAYPRWGLDVGEWICDRPVDASDAPEGALPMLDDFATAAILLRMCAEAESDLHSNRHTPRMVYADATSPEQNERRWACHTEPGIYSWTERVDPGTVAAQALLDAWKEP